jgi:hypothetical protein
VQVALHGLGQRGAATGDLFRAGPSPGIRIERLHVASDERAEALTSDQDRRERGGSNEEAAA